MKLVRTIERLRHVVSTWRAHGLCVAVVPTMGGLHAGHISLVALALTRVDRVVTTLFVNPTQFGAGEDLDAYPRTEEADARMLDEAGCHLLFAPSPAEVYPEGFSTRVLVDGLTDVLCGKVRPGHFDGVAQVVTKLLNQAQADIAVFGEKDWQQLAVVRRMARDLDIPTEIVGAPTVREADGLAMSSRNRYLTKEQRQAASVLPATMQRSVAGALKGKPLDRIIQQGKAALLDAGFSSIDYLVFCHAATLQPLEALTLGEPARIFVAAHLGRARLIDNWAVV